MGTRTRKDWKLDNQGQYARQIGWKVSPDGKLSQHKFRLGTDLKEAKRREQKLQEFWERIEATISAEQLLWNSFTLSVAKLIAKGKLQIPIPQKPHDNAQAYARYVNRVQQHYPMISFIPEDEEAYLQGAAHNRSVVQDQIDELEAEIALRQKKHLRIGNISEIDVASLGETLHDAMRAYIDWIEKDYFRPALGRINANGHTKIRQVKTLIEKHDNLPLSRLNEEIVEEMFRFWRQRPCRKGTTKPITKKSAENYIAELKRFLRWMHKSKQYDWRKPEDFDEIKTKVDADPGECQGKLAQVDTFSLEELCLLNKYATPLERVFLLLGINCGFGTAEIASLTIGELVLFHGHDNRFQEILGFPTTNADSFIKRVRRKNGVYGEFILYPQTIAGMQWALQHRKSQHDLKPEAVLLLNDHAEPYDKPTKSGNRNQQIPNRWADLIRRIRVDYKEFPELSFGKLRKTAGDLIRRFADGEIHGIFMCHGQPVASDDLTDVYSNRPFGKVFQTIKNLQEYLAPMFAAAGTDPFVQPPKAYTSHRTKDKILKLYEEGMSVQAIADKVGKSRMVVYRHLRRR